MRTFIQIIIFLFLSSCAYDRHNKLIRELISNQTKFENLIDRCYNDQELLNKINKFVTYDELSENTKTALNILELGQINYVVLGRPDCNEATKQKIEIIFNGNEHLEYSQCIDELYEPGHHDEIKEKGIDIY